MRVSRIVDHSTRRATDRASNDKSAAGNSRTLQNHRDGLARRLPKRSSDHLACGRLYTDLANATACISRNAHDRADCHQH